MSTRSLYPGRVTGTCRDARDLLCGLVDPDDDDEREPTRRERAVAALDRHDRTLILGEPHGADCPWCRYRRLHPDTGATPNGR